MFKKIKNIVQSILPIFVWEKLKKIKNYILFRITLKKVQMNHKIALEKARKKARNGQKIKVVFFPIQEQAWKYENLYRLLDKSPLFDPILVVCPYLAYGTEIMQDILDKAYKYFKEKDYTVINSYSKESNTWLDVKKEIKPDIVFFSVPYNYTKTEYCINNFLDTLTCYVPYAYVVIGNYLMHYDYEVHNFCWKYFLETSDHVKFAQQVSRNRGLNAVLSGYPGVDPLIEKKIKSDPWKIKSINVKRIIWSPHHTIEGFDAGLQYSNFIELSTFMLNLLKNYNKKIQIAFKPHPLLKSRLYKHPEWGKDKTDNYYKEWDLLSNGFLTDSDYADLFLTSDALIHDCASFLAEYLYTGKPVFFVKKDEKVINRFNDFGQKLFKVIYQGYGEADIVQFIENVVINNNDYMKKDRDFYVNENLMPPNNQLASQNIFDNIMSELQG